MLGVSQRILDFLVKTSVRGYYELVSVKKSRNINGEGNSVRLMNAPVFWSIFCNSWRNVTNII